ncbi:heme exporter protein CcmD [Actibacterium mucosum]|uniref:heme exporter protein CcmD n=1 Tax=Actibacterium mucosum TaxID=1087332 RepID=UPI0009E008F9|nr:heme exporter protein CcmD [Actibacterium mucosum]
MPDLGFYATAVLSAYGISLVSLAAIILASIRRGAMARRRLAEAEAREAAK